MQTESSRLFFEAKGKLMLFGEYVVMRGVPALAFPIKMGQTLEISESEHFIWESYEVDKLWFFLKFNAALQIEETNNLAVAEKLMAILGDLKSHNPQLFSKPLHFVMRANFNRNWGFGSSATMISLLAQWSGLDAYSLNDNHFGGSGYDIACATARNPILYSKHTREVKSIEIPRTITNQLLFVYLGKKQNSQQEVTKFSDLIIHEGKLDEIKKLILDAAQTADIEYFEELIDAHEAHLSEILQRPTLKSLEFADYDYSIKSLGAWGGDFFMATCRNIDEARMYFIEKGKEVAFTWDMLV